LAYISHGKDGDMINCNAINKVDIRPKTAAVSSHRNLKLHPLYAPVQLPRINILHLFKRVVVISDVIPFGRQALT
jgi:hypothetical protein